MSYTALIPFKNCLPQGEIEFRNAWGGSARIWTSLFDAYIPKKHEYDPWLSSSSNGDDRRLWDLAKREDLPLFERAVHVFTFDRFYVRKENFPRLAADLRLFAEKYPVAGLVDHLPAWAQWLEQNSEVEAVGLRGTSVSENPWWRSKLCPHCEQSIDETEAIPLAEGTEVYEWFENLVKEKMKGEAK